MKTILKRLACAALVAVVMLSCLPALARAADGDEIRAAKKIISVVCDDSGSMEGDRWTYANYATQAMIAQLNEQDELYITFMSNPGQVEKVNLQNIASEVRDLGDRDCPGGTPFEAVETAYNKLKSVSAQDSNAQYWLIVTTDGSIGDIPKSGGMKGTIQGVLDTYKGKKMANGSGLNVAYLAMDAKYACKGDTGKGLHTFKATNPKEISQSLVKISNLISSRLEASSVTQVDGKTISFRSELPIYSFSVLSQQSAATVSAASADGKQLHINRNIALKKDGLFGNVSVVQSQKSQGGSQVIPAGEYTVQFSQDVDVSNLLIQYEPAIGVKMEIRSDGVIVSDPSQLPVGADFTVELIPVIPGTETLIDPATLPDGVRWRIEHTSGGNLISGEDSTKLSGAKVQAGDNEIRGILRIPGFSELVFQEQFHVIKIVYGLTVRQPEELSYPRVSPQKQVTDENSIVFTVTNDGVPMDKQMLNSLGVSLETVSVTVDSSNITPWFLRGMNPASVSYRMNDDGTFTLIPRTLRSLAIFTLGGDYTVTVTINNDRQITAQGHFRLVPDGMDIVWPVLSLLLLLWLIMILTKRKFSRGTVAITQYTPGSGGTGEYVATYTVELDVFAKGNLLAPTFKPCRVKSKGLKVDIVADSGNAVLVSGRSIEKNQSIVAYGTSTFNPERKLGSIKRSLSEVAVDEGDGKKKRVASDVELSVDNPLYLEGKSGNIYRLNLLG